MGGVHWNRFTGLRTPLLMILAFACLAVGAFQIYRPAGWIVIGLALLFIAYVTDSEVTPGARSR